MKQSAFRPSEIKSTVSNIENPPRGKNTSFKEQK